MRDAGFVAFVSIYAYTFVVGKRVGNSQFGRYKRRWAKILERTSQEK